MVRACAVRDCKNNLKRKIIFNKPNLLFHKFPPAGSSIWRKWVAFCCNGDGWAPSVSACICSEHFSKRMFSKKVTSKRRRMLLKDAVPTIHVRAGNAVCEDDLIRLHERVGIKKRKIKDPSDVETLLEEYFEGVAGKDDHLPPLKEQVSEKIHKVHEVEEDDSFNDIIDDSFTSARICDTNKARQIASEVLSSESDVQMLVVVTPEDLKAYNQNINLENKPSLKALMNDPAKSKMDDIRKIRAGIRNNLNATLPNKLTQLDQHKENSSPPSEKIVEENQTKLCSKEPVSVLQEKLSQQNSSLLNAINPPVNAQCSAVESKKDNEAAGHAKNPKEFCSNTILADHRYHIELSTSARNKSIPFTEVTNTTDVMTLSGDSPPQSSSEKNQRQHNHLPLSSIDNEMRRLSTSDEEDIIDSPETATEQSPAKQVDIIKCFSSQSGKNLFFQADDDDLRILNSGDASYAYSMHNYDSSNSSVISDNNEDQDEEEDDEEPAEEVDKNNSYEEIELSDVMNKDRQELTSSRILTSKKKSDKSSFMGLIEELVDNKRIKSAEKRMTILEIENEKLKIGSEKLKIENENVKNGNEKLKIENEKVKIENEKLKIENENVKIENEKLKIENKKVKIENEKLKIQNEKVKSENENVKSENGKLNREIFELAAQLKSPDHVKNVLKKSLSGFVRELAIHEYETRLKNHSNKGLCYPDELRTFANTVYMNSPRTYRYLRTLFKLPNPSNLRVTLNALRKDVKTHDRMELFKHIHGTDSGEDYILGDVEEDEPRVEMSSDRQVTLIESDIEIDKETDENLPTEELTSAEMIRKDLTEDSPDESIGSIENDTNEVSSQLLNLIENCEVYFEDEAGNIIPPDSKQIMEYVEAATKMVEEIGPDGQKRYVILQMDDGERTPQSHETTVEVSESPEQTRNTTQSRKKLVAQKKSNFKIL